MATKIEELKTMRDTPNLPTGVKSLFQTAIDREEFKSGQTSQEVVANALGQISKILAQAQVQKGAGVDADEVERMVKIALADAKIGMSNLDANVTKMLSNQKIEATLTLVSDTGITTTQTIIDPEFLMRPLTQLMLSDTAARNNVYLYGGAGTGKTYTANELAKLLDWVAVEVNCNQFTSPLDLLGGQTISGYQEGLVVQAWRNEVNGKPVKGVVLVLDELPKIDPNTAGILNSALAKVKLGKERNKITNGRGEKFEKQNIVIIGTGNVKLNETSEDYEANFKQDLSLQDRFAGSTYEIFVYYTTEVTTTMNGFLFIWLYLVKVREYIEQKRLTARAFVSIRLMESVRDTYIVYRTAESRINAPNGESLIKNPKTIQQACESFFSLFPLNIQEDMKRETDYEGFKQIIMEKNAMPIVDPQSMNFDTPQEKANALAMAEKHDLEKNKIYQTN
jgi:cobaltochelatase CobS